MSRPPAAQSENRFFPSLEPLEQRLLPLDLVFHFEKPPPPHDVIIHIEPNYPRTGGVALQTGSTLNVGVASIASVGPLAQLGFSLILEDGAGHVAVSWDGQPFQFFSGVNQLNLVSNAPLNGVFLFSTALQQQQALQVNFALEGTLNAVFEHLPPLPGAPLSVNTSSPVPIIPF